MPTVPPIPSSALMDQIEAWIRLHQREYGEEDEHIVWALRGLVYLAAKNVIPEAVVDRAWWSAG